MEFKTERLRAAVTQAMADDKASWTAHQDEREAKHSTAIEEWNADHAPSWTEALPRLKAMLRKGAPITAKDLPNRDGRYGDRYVAYFDATPPTRGQYAPTTELSVLANVLALIEDETVTTGSLRQLGITPTIIRRLAEILKTEVPK